MGSEKQLFDQVIHPLEPVYDHRSQVLIIGTMPSPASRSAQFYYMHPQNRFWTVMAELFVPDRPSTLLNATVAQRKAFLLTHHIALWDVLYSCSIRNARDSSIRDPVANELNRIVKNAPINTIFTNGIKASQLYQRYCRAQTGLDAVCLPSTSSANRTVSLRDLISAYDRVRESLVYDR